LIVLFKEAVDRGLQVGDGAKDALEPALREVAKKPSTALSQEADVGVKGRFDGLQESIASSRAHRRRSRACGRP